MGPKSALGPGNYAAFNSTGKPRALKRKGVETFKGKYELNLQNKIYSLNSKS